MRETVKNSDFYYFGVNAKTFKEANYKAVALGAVASVVTHTAGHYAYAGLTGMRVQQDGLHEIVDGKAPEHNLRDFSMAGFALQNGVGLILTSIPATRQSDFTKGYVTAAFVETAFYPAFFRGESGDLYMSNQYGGNADIEYAIFTAIATHNMLRVKWHKD
jgi:hypothetical protein